LKKANELYRLSSEKNISNEEYSPKKEKEEFIKALNVFK